VAEENIKLKKARRSLLNKLEVAEVHLKSTPQKWLAGEVEIMKVMKKKHHHHLKLLEVNTVEILI
tara:strand:- start:153 stop:347 length:195 start_codon:yes stop_codon:yes gene_type:complete